MQNFEPVEEKHKDKHYTSYLKVSVSVNFSLLVAECRKIFIRTFAGAIVCARQANRAIAREFTDQK
jgi:hypothetical protein